jgi:lipopolysaccharide export LptBFGC system permease protein LptF
MTNFFKYGFFVLIAAFVAYVTLWPEPEGNQQYVDQLHEQIDALNVKNSRLKEQNKQISVDLSLKADSIAALAVDIQDIKKQRIAAIRYYEKRINNIDKLTTHELDSFFLARYGGSRDTTEVDRN